MSNDRAADRPGVRAATMRHAHASFPSTLHTMPHSACAHTGPVFWGSDHAKSCDRYSDMMPWRRCTNSTVKQRVLTQLKERAFVLRQSVLPSSSIDQIVLTPALLLREKRLQANPKPRIRRCSLVGTLGSDTLTTGAVVVPVVLLYGTVRLKRRFRRGLVHASRATPPGRM